MASHSTTALGRAELTDGLRRLLGGGHPCAVWSEGGDEVVVHAARTTVAVLDGALVVTVPLECAEAGRGDVEVLLALAGGGERPGLVAATETLPCGAPLLVGRWGTAVQDAVWSAVLTLAADGDFGEAAGAVAGLVAEDGGLTVSHGDAS